MNQPVGARNVPLKNCPGLFQAARAGRLRIKAKYPECQGLALRVAVTSYIKTAMTTICIFDDFVASAFAALLK
jgi:hypothetical protein